MYLEILHEMQKLCTETLHQQRWFAISESMSGHNSFKVIKSRKINLSTDFQQKWINS